MIPSLAPAELRDKQNADPCIHEVLRQVESGEKPPPSVRKELPELGLLLREWNKLEVLNGVLYCKRQEGAQTHYQLVLPEALRSLILKSLHDNMDHMGTEHTLDLVRKRFYWPKMSAKVETKVKTCNRCTRRKTMPRKLHHLSTSLLQDHSNLCAWIFSVWSRTPLTPKTFWSLPTILRNMQWPSPPQIRKPGQWPRACGTTFSSITASLKNSGMPQ